MATASADFNLNFWNMAQVSKASAILANATVFAFSENAEKLFAWNNLNFEITAQNLPEKSLNWMAKTKINAFSTDFSAAKNILAFGERDGFISLFEAVGGREIRRSKTHERNIYAVAFAPDGAKFLSLTKTD